MAEKHSNGFTAHITKTVQFPMNLQVETLDQGWCLRAKRPHSCDVKCKEICLMHVDAMT